MTKTENSVLEVRHEIEESYDSIFDFIECTREEVYTAILDGFKLLVDSGVETVILTINGTAEDLNWSTPFYINKDKVEYLGNLMNFFIGIEAYEKCGMVQSIMKDLDLS